MKLIRRIFYTIVILFLFPAMAMPLALSTDVDVEGSSYFAFTLIMVLVLTIGLIAMILFGIAPVVIELLDARKKERDEEDDIGIFP